MHIRFNFPHHRTRLILLCLLMVGVIGVMILIFIQSNRVQAPAAQMSNQPQTSSPKPPVEPLLTTNEVVSGLKNPWDVVFLPDSSMLFNERSGVISRFASGQKIKVADISDVYAVGEGGLTGLALDTDFATNRLLYTCFNARTASGIDVRLVRWKLNSENTALIERSDIVIGIPSNASGRHSGCRIRSDKTGNLWVGTGDAAKASNPQDPKSLGGKILHITRDGMPASGNLPAPYDPRIFSYGHRNVQGLVLFDEPQNGVYGYSIEHGSNKDDEINLLKPGNFGWAPRVTYIEAGIPMTDTARFPDAISAIWSSGSPTIAPSGGSLLKGEQWGTWNGSVAMAVLKGKQVRIMTFDANNTLKDQKAVLTDFGRIRSVAQGPKGTVYITTDNGSNDKIIQVTPTGN